MYSYYLALCCLLFVCKLTLFIETGAFPTSRLAGNNEVLLKKRNEFWRSSASKPSQHDLSIEDIKTGVPRKTARKTKEIKVMTAKRPMGEEVLRAVRRLKLFTEPATNLPSKKTTRQVPILKEVPKPTARQSVSPAGMQAWKTKEILAGPERGDGSLVKAVYHLEKTKETSSAAVQDIHRTEHHIPVNMCITELSSGKYNEGKLLLAIKDCLKKKKWFENNKKPFSLEQCMDSDLPQEEEIRFALEQCLGKDYDLLGIKAEEVLKNSSTNVDDKLEELSEIKKPKSTKEEKPLQHLLQKGLSKKKIHEEHDMVKKTNANVFRSVTGIAKHIPVDRCLLELLSNKHNQENLVTALERCKESEKLSKYLKIHFSFKNCLLEEFPTLKQCVNKTLASKLEEEPEIVDTVSTEDNH